MAGHLEHGDRAATTYFLDEDGDSHGRPDGSIVACARPDGWVEQGDDACVPVFAFSDGFNGAGLDPAWSIAPGLFAPVLEGGAACGDVQSAAFRACIGDASAWRVTFRFRALSSPGREAYAAFSDGEAFTAGATTYLLGCDGGHDEGIGGVLTCGLTIFEHSTDQHFAGLTTAGIEVGVEYTLVADVAADGSLAVEVFDGGVSKLRLTAVAPDRITVRSAGFVVGREPDGSLTCLDDFTLTSTP